MGRPLNKRYFGSDIGKIKVLFHNGISVVEGYIVKQVSDYVFDLSQDGSTITRCYLAQTTNDATTLIAGKFSISITTELGILYVRHLSSVNAITTENLSFSWAEGLATGAKGLLGFIQPAPPPPPSGPSAEITLDFLGQKFTSMGNEVAITDLLQDGDFGTYDPTATAGGLQNAEPAFSGDALNAVLNGCSIVFHIECSSDTMFLFVTSDPTNVQEANFYASPDQDTGFMELSENPLIIVPALNVNSLNTVAVTVSNTHLAMSVNGSIAQTVDYVGVLSMNLTGVIIVGSTGSYVSAIEIYPIVSDAVLAQL